MMTCHQIGGARVMLEAHSTDRDGKTVYRGEVRIGRRIVWEFDDLHAWDDDQAAQSAISFGSYYSTGNRGDDVPEWAPAAGTADKIGEVTSHVQDDQGNYKVRACWKR